jgi:hypothetical protein
MRLVRPADHPAKALMATITDKDVAGQISTGPPPLPNPKWRALDAFNHLGANARDKFAWSAQSDDRAITVITLWIDQIQDTGTTVTADFFGHSELAVWVGMRGNRTRTRHLEDVWAGDREFRVVLIEARDPKANPRIAKARWPDDRLRMKLLALDPRTGEFRAEGTRSDEPSMADSD